MRILTVCSGLDFINYTRRATIEAIKKLNPKLDILLFNSLLNIHKKKRISIEIKFYNYHFWVVERLRKYKVFIYLEYLMRYPKWKYFFSRYDLIFFIDPNQYYLLPYLQKKHIVVYLLRDPSVLQDISNFKKELAIINRANLILGISKNLCSYYFEKYYGVIPSNVKLWPNSVDLNLWNLQKWKDHKKPKQRDLIGLAGNINYVIDLKLLKFIAQGLPEIDLEIAGKVDLDKDEMQQWQELLSFQNVRYLGFIPYDVFPSIVVNWEVGLVAAKQDQEYARYLNNNKQFQYIALGKPFVSYSFNSDYTDFEDFVFIAETPEDYIEKIRVAIVKSKAIETSDKYMKLISNISAEKRGIQFLEIVNNLK